MSDNGDPSGGAAGGDPPPTSPQIEPEPAPRTERAAVRSHLVKAVFRAFVHWLGETVVLGLLPLYIKAVMFSFTDPEKLHSVPPHSAGFLEGASEEMNILTVVLTGLGLASLLEFDVEGLKSRFTPFTYIFAVICVVFIVAGSLLFAIGSTDMGHGIGGASLALLIFALLITVFLAVEQAWLGALDEELTSKGDDRTR